MTYRACVRPGRPRRPDRDIDEFAHTGVVDGDSSPELVAKWSHSAVGLS
ncbi:hypothetical protein [Mycobacterium gastri]|nr:hypothetical protein [Mycobacterium gastri]